MSVFDRLVAREPQTEKYAVVVGGIFDGCSRRLVDVGAKLFGETQRTSFAIEEGVGRGLGVHRAMDQSGAHRQDDRAGRHNDEQFNERHRATSFHGCVPPGGGFWVVGRIQAAMVTDVGCSGMSSQESCRVRRSPTSAGCSSPVSFGPGKLAAMNGDGAELGDRGLCFGRRQGGEAIELVR